MTDKPVTSQSRYVEIGKIYKIDLINQRQILAGLLEEIVSDLTPTVFCVQAFALTRQHSEDEPVWRRSAKLAIPVTSIVTIAPFTDEESSQILLSAGSGKPAPMPL